MHDPMVVVFDVPPYSVRRRLPKFLDWSVTVWHHEPDGKDSGQVCKGMYSSDLSVHNLLWAWRHRDHVRLQWSWLGTRVRRWIIDRCGECGRRFLWKDARFGYMSGTEHYHGVCMDLRHVRGELDDLTGYVRNEADNNARWRVEYRLEKIAKAETPDGD